MSQTNEWFFALIFFSGILGIVVAGILFFMNRNESLSPRLLSGYLLMLALISLHIGLTFSSFYLNFPHLWRSTAWATFCAPVMAYLYVRSVVQQSFRLQKWDWLLFVPAILYTLNLLPYYLSSSTEKLAVVSRFMSDKTLIASEPEGLLPEGWGVMARLILGISLLMVQFKMLVKMRRKIIISGHAVKQNETTYRWLVLLTVFLTFMYIILIGEHIFHLSKVIDLTNLIFFTISGMILFISLYLLVRPSILYGMEGWIQESESDIPTSKAEVNQINRDEKRPSLTIEQGIAFKVALENHFLHNLPYRKSGYKIRDLSEELDIPSYQLSVFINQEYGKNFNELVNDYRVDFMAGQLRDSPEKLQFTLEALAKEAGFNSRNSFFTAVKKKTGKTPSEFFGTKSLSIDR
jgi:AraC-like DNA-binding protein